MSVANLLPGDDVTVEVDWTETIPALDSTYEFVFPTVVGPRYTGGPPNKPAENWSANPYLKKGTHNPATLSIDVALGTALPLAEVTCPSHPVAVDFKAKDRATRENRHPRRRGRRQPGFHPPLETRRRPGGCRSAASQGRNDESFPAPGRAAETRDAGADPAARLCDGARCLGLDVRLSAGHREGPAPRSGAGIENHRHLQRPLFRLRQRASIRHSDAATPENLDRAKRFIDGQNAGGGTELAAALQRSFSLPGGDDRSRSILLVTDGFITADAAVRDLIRSKIGAANLFAFGIGSSVNRDLIEATARAGGGEPTIVTTTAEAAPAAKRFLELHLESGAHQSPNRGGGRHTRKHRAGRHSAMCLPPARSSSTAPGPASPRARSSSAASVATARHLRRKSTSTRSRGTAGWNIPRCPCCGRGNASAVSRNNPGNPMNPSVKSPRWDSATRF